MQFPVAPSPDVGYGMMLEKGPLAGQYYRIAVSTCQNPVCRCERLSLYCYSDPDAPMESHSPDPIHLEMDLSTRAITNLEELKRDRLAYTFAISVKSEISDEEWDKLGMLLLALKEQQTEEADPGRIQTHFPPEVLSGEGSVVGYYEILPYAQPVVVVLDGISWLFDDGYCVNPECTCQEVAISFVSESTSPGSDHNHHDLTKISVRYAYDTGEITADLTPEVSHPTRSDLLRELESVQPNLNSFLTGRHALLRRLFQRAITRNTIRRRNKSVGRNDPCPCGSGKKYKRCCGVQ